ncbi:MAG: class I lanthipeptide [Bacteroidetes bacterium]|nr:class I lanthipeptide [Bacteroidota bacterium]MBS1739188.1 class I lanthipeptide [Bacteroidota bacterium]
MKKMKIAASQLKLTKERIAALQADEMSHVHGGENYVPVDVTIADPPAFTYSLSWGAVCQKSQAMTAKNSYDCGRIYGSIAGNCPSQ